MIHLLIGALLAILIYQKVKSPYTDFFNDADSQKFMCALLHVIQWKQEQIFLFGKYYDLPRLTAWYRDRNKTYHYSGLILKLLPWIAVLKEIKSKIESVSRIAFNSVLLSRYRSGADSVSWHSDNEIELGQNPIIGSVSFGQFRQFKLKHKFTRQRKDIELTHGGFLLMGGSMQQNWLHEITKSNDQGERINLTFWVIQ